MRNHLIELVEKKNYRQVAPQFRIGDTVDVHCRIVEGDKERIQVYTGVVIARRGGGINERFTVRRIVGDEGVERTFLYHSPNVVNVKVRRHGKVRRAKLYYLRQRVGKARKVRELRVSKKEASIEPQLAGSAA
jgi:large subunit ribosomal protein L19